MPVSRYILIVEDDAKLGSLLQELLSLHGYEADLVDRGDEALRRVVAKQPGLVILDIGLPRLDGIEVCRQARAQGYGGLILMLTARREESDEVEGLDVGADDFLTKPVSPTRLLARVRALLRRKAEEEASQATQIHCGGLVIDAQQRKVVLEGRELKLTSSEFDLLHLLARNIGKALHRDEICMALYGHEYNGLDRSVDVTISRIRRRLGDDTRSPSWIKTVQGTGYVLVRRSS